MKKLLLMVICMLSFSVSTFADGDKPIRFHALPMKAQTYIHNHFSRADILKVTEKEDGDGYEVKLVKDIEIEFDRKGRWKEIEAKRKGIPNAMIPPRILDKVIEHFGNEVRIMEISREKDEIEVKLSNGKEMKFDREKRTIKVDD